MSKIALITGGGSGIGKACAVKLAKGGADGLCERVSSLMEQ